MISYMHIPTDWNTFLPPILPASNKSRRIMMCGRKARYAYSGIPGITSQEAVVGDRPGWCVECARSTLKEAALTITSSPELQAVYDITINEIDRVIKVWIDKGLVVSKNGH